MNGRNI